MCITVCLSRRMYTLCIQEPIDGSVRSPGASLLDSYQPPGSCWVPNLGLQEHQVLSTAELSLWPVIICIWFEIYSATFILVYILDFLMN